MEIRDDVSINDKELIHEYNPSLRVEDNEKSNQFALDVMSFKAGLGTKYYRFDNGTVVTATQLDKFITDIMLASLYIEKVIFGAKVNDDCNILH